MMSDPSRDIKAEYDEDSQGCYIVWQPPVVVGTGQTEREAIEDLRTAAHFGVETIIDLKLKEIGEGMKAAG